MLICLIDPSDHPSVMYVWKTLDLSYQLGYPLVIQALHEPLRSFRGVKKGILGKKALIDNSDHLSVNI